MTATEALERRIDELCAEVERLRQERREYQATIDSLVDECADHKAENAKLRELMRDFYDAIDSVFWDGETETRERFKPRMRELGVEVDV